MKVRAAITAVGGYLPEYVLTNAELETMVDTNDKWIRSRTGIETRHILKGPHGTSVLGIEAVKNLLEQTDYTAADIDLLICATTTPDHKFPATANIISDAVGAVNAWSFDISAACSGFLFALQTASRFIETGTHKRVIVVGADKMSSIIDYTDRNTCVIFGDGAGAVLLEPNTEGNGVIDAVLRSDGSGKKHLYMKSGGSKYPPTLETVKNKEHYVYQEGKAVYKFAVKV